MIVHTIRTHYPNVQAVYLFGSYGTEQQWPDSDADIVLLLPADEAKRAGSLAMTDLHAALERLLGTEVDLINLRQVSTVFQKEIIMAELTDSRIRMRRTSLKCWSSHTTRS